jgi:hypothetical protein
LKNVISKRNQSRKKAFSKEIENKSFRLRRRLVSFQVLAGSLVAEAEWDVSSEPSQQALLMQQWVAKSTVRLKSAQPRANSQFGPVGLGREEMLVTDPRASKGLVNVAPLGEYKNPYYS